MDKRKAFENRLSPDGERWISCRPGFFLPVRVLSRLFQRLFLERLVATHEAGRLRFFGDLRHLADSQAFDAYLLPLRKIEWVVYAKRPFAGPEAVLAYLSRYTHRVAISNSRLIALDDKQVIFKWKDYQIKTVTATGPTEFKTLAWWRKSKRAELPLWVISGSPAEARECLLLGEEQT